jgi:hypothetical protein
LMATSTGLTAEGHSSSDCSEDRRIVAPRSRTPARAALAPVWESVTKRLKT